MPKTILLRKLLVAPAITTMTTTFQKWKTSFLGNIGEKKWEILALILNMRPLGSYLTIEVRKVAFSMTDTDLKLGLKY